MTLRTKITALTALLIFIATALLGVIAFWTTRTIQYDSLRLRLRPPPYTRCRARCAHEITAGQAPTIAR